MNTFPAVSLVTGLLIGAAGGYGLQRFQQQNAVDPTDNSATHSIEQPDSKKLLELNKQLLAANNELAILREKVAIQAEALAIGSSSTENNSLVETTLSDELVEDEQTEPQESLYDLAMEALLTGDHQQASKLFNQLRLSATNDEQKQQATEGLLAIQEQNYNELRSTSGKTNAALWSLFEMHKLQPDDQTKIELVGVSVQAYEEAQQYLTEDNLLASADHLSSLMHLSRMMQYKVPVQGEGFLDSSDFAEELQEIQGDPAYLPRLEVRAESNLYNGDNQQKSQVFWDYTQIASLKGPKTMSDPRFRTQFVQATVEHLNFLRNSNQSGELQSRINYIRYAFPQIMNDPLISSFQ